MATGDTAGHNRYAHITGLRGEAVSPRILWMKKIISENALRRCKRPGAAS